MVIESSLVWFFVLWQWQCSRASGHGLGRLFLGGQDPWGIPMGWAGLAHPSTPGWQWGSHGQLGQPQASGTSLRTGKGPGWQEYGMSGTAWLSGQLAGQVPYSITGNDIPGEAEIGSWAMGRVGTGLGAGQWLWWPQSPGTQQPLLVQKWPCTVCVPIQDFTPVFPGCAVNACWCSGGLFLDLWKEGSEMLWLLVYNDIRGYYADTSLNRSCNSLISAIQTPVYILPSPLPCVVVAAKIH